MQRSRADVGQMSLDDYVSTVVEIYSLHDGHRSIWDVWCHTLHHAAAVAEQISKGARGKKLYREIADFSLWLFTAVLKLRGKFGQPAGKFEGPQDDLIRIQGSCSDLLWHKYPKRCSFCIARGIADDPPSGVGLPHLISCDCPTDRPESEKKEARRQRIIATRHYSGKISDQKPIGIDEWQKMFGTINRVIHISRKRNRCNPYGWNDLVGMGRGSGEHSQ